MISAAVLVGIFPMSKCIQLLPQVFIHQSPKVRRQLGPGRKINNIVILSSAVRLEDFFILGILSLSDPNLTGQ